MQAMTASNQEQSSLPYLRLVSVHNEHQSLKGRDGAAPVEVGEDNVLNRCFDSVKAILACAI